MDFIFNSNLIDSELVENSFKKTKSQGAPDFVEELCKELCSNNRRSIFLVCPI